MHIPIEFLWGTLIILGVVVLAILARTLFKLHIVLNRLDVLLMSNDKSINDSIEQLPKILMNLESITSTADEELKNVQEKIHDVESKLTNVAMTAQSVADNFVMPAREILGLVSIAKKLFYKRKKKFF